jgi:hypothetical protein
MRRFQASVLFSRYGYYARREGIYWTTASSIHEVSGITRKLRNNIARGEGSITAELVEGGDRRLWKNTNIVMERGWQSSGIVSSQAQHLKRTTRWSVVTTRNFTPEYDLQSFYAVGGQMSRTLYRRNTGRIPVLFS